MLLIYILIILFSILIGSQLIEMYFPNKLVEGLESTIPIDTTNTTTTNTSEYKPYNLGDPNNALILAQQNAGNIEVLKGRIDILDGVKGRVDTMQQSIDSMQTQIDGLVQQQADFAQEIAGSTPPTVTGTEGTTTADVEASIEDEEQQ
jgi:hypothetical protein